MLARNEALVQRWVSEAAEGKRRSREAPHPTFAKMDEKQRQEAAATAEIAREANDREQELIEFVKSRAVGREAQIDGAKARHLLAKQEERRRRCIENYQTLMEQKYAEQAMAEAQQIAELRRAEHALEQTMAIAERRLRALRR